MTAKRVLLLNIRSLLMEGVEGLLESNGNGKFDVVSTTARNLVDLTQKIEQVKPSIIVMDKVTSFIQPAELIAALLDTRRIRLIVLNSETSIMDIYDKSEIVISNSSHLMEALSDRAPLSLR